MRGLVLGSLAVAAAAGPASVVAAEPRPFGLVVMDAQGQFVADLRAEDVRVLENGEPRELAGFERDERPLAAYLVLDTSAGAARVFRTQAFESVWSFVSRLPEGARCTLFATGDRPRKLGALDGERRDVEKKIGQGFALEGPNALMDTVVEAANALARESGKRRALVVLSGAGAGHTSYSPADVATQGRRPAAPVLALMYGEGEAATAGSLRLGDSPRDAANLTIVGAPDHERILSGLAQGTGGRFERVPSALGVGTTFATLSGELGGQYRLRYVPGDVQGARRLEVRVARPGVRWRVTLDNP
jgi:VWFA-related protein